jgi:5-methyltetrahydrofolate--homocysteine methyltransferase
LAAFIRWRKNALYFLIGFLSLMQSQNFLNQIRAGVILLSDGAMGTELQKRGMPTGVCPEEYNIIHPEIVQGIYRDYYAAGSDIVETNTFGANRSRLALHNFEHRVAEFCKASAQLARAVCPAGKFVAGSMGPTGDLIEPLGPRTVPEVYDIFAEQAIALAEGGVDVIFVETMMAAEEAEIAVRAVKEKTHLPVAATMTFELGKAGLRTMWGVDVSTAAHRLTAAGADVIGANCGRGFDEMIAIMQEMRPLTDKPIIAQSNAGIPDWVDGVSVYNETPEIIQPKAEKLLQLGVNILGGCCGTGPEHIKKMRAAVDAFMAKSA